MTMPTTVAPIIYDECVSWEDHIWYLEEGLKRTMAVLFGVLLSPLLAEPS